MLPYCRQHANFFVSDLSLSQVLQERSNDILTAVVQGMRKEEPNMRVRLAATKALLNSLEFTRSNFENEQERHHIMQVCPFTAFRLVGSVQLCISPFETL